MVDAALASPPAPDQADEDWRAGLTHWAVGIRDAYRRHPSWSLRSSQAVVTAETGGNLGGSLAPSTAVMGCLIANGRERLLANSASNNVDGGTDYPLAGLGGTYAGVVADNSEDHYFLMSVRTVEMFDLRSGAGSGFGGESSDCALGVVCGIDRVVVGSDGVSAVHVDPGAPGDAIRLSCASASFCVANKGFGDVSFSTSPATGPWSSSPVALLQKVSCPSPALCVGVGWLQKHSGVRIPAACVQSFVVCAMRLAASTRSPSRRRTPSWLQSVSDAPGPLRTSGAIFARRRSAVASACSRCRVEAGEHSDRRSGRLRSLCQCRDRCVGSEEEDAPAVGAQEEPEGEQGDVVLLAGRAGEQRERPAAAAPEPGE